MDRPTKITDRYSGDDELGLATRPDPGRTVKRLIAVLIMLVIAISGSVYSGWLLWHLPSKP